MIIVVLLMFTYLSILHMYFYSLVNFHIQLHYLIFFQITNSKRFL
jgi:hypothetical protein